MFEENQEKFMVPWDMQCYHRFFETFREEWDNSNALLLQLGAGPCIYDLISAAPYVTEIYHSDYLESCCNEVLLWRNKDPKAYNWSPYFRYVVNTLEGKVGPHAVAEREKILRHVIKDSFTWDVNQSPIILPRFLKFPDIISTSCCLEFVTSSKDRYIAVVKEIFGLLKPKGFLLMLSNLECSWYMVKDVKMAGICLNEKDIEEVVKEAGFAVRFKDSSEKPLPARNINNDSTGHLFFALQKI